MGDCSKNSVQKTRNPWNINTQRENNKPKSNGAHLKKKLSASSVNKFQEAQRKLQEAVQKYAKDYESSSEEEDVEVNAVISSILKTYESAGVKNEHIGRTQGYLEEAFLSGAISCLICICKIKHADYIWNCSECYCSFHLSCIQRWSKDTITQQKLALEDQIQVRKIKLIWGCPKCRHDYTPDDIPDKYTCFCYKTVNPVFQPLLAPHSCGETCGKPLKPDCGHHCLLLCHPGPCPPCPQTVKITCYCGKKAPKLQRCSNREWSCGEPCNKQLLCKKHSCIQVCHSGDCKPCPKKSVQRCLCGANQKLKDCTTPIWQCDKVCGKLLDCGNHFCSEICHVGKCEPCVLSKPRKCPCGKSKYELPCTQETPTCGDTCGKTLECGLHICNQRCHKDKCSPCLETITKSCRCGLHTREVQCKKPYLCETKCKQIKDCNKHPCNRKCCDGNCPPCEKPCGKTLNCGNHKCSSICHRGPCYPCNLTEVVSCRCGETTITVPCGRKHKTKPPKCSKPCKISPECHHEKQELHRCHFGDCPPCKQKCNKNRPGCSHKCPAVCHTSVLIKIETSVSMPWDKGVKFEKQKLPCPNCVVPVPVTCFGKHETINLPCHIAKPSSCHKPCGRLLQCENHTCTRPCHVVKAAPDDIKAGTNCETCETSCEKPRPKGCPHSCLKPCHPGPCPQCKQMLRVKCHCGLNQPYIPCRDWTSAENKDELQSCGNQCPKNYDCGHRCRANCHPGPCPNPEACKKKVKVTCKCKRIKKEFSCETIRKNAAHVECDEVCLQKQEEEKKKRQLLEEQKKREEEIKNKRELEKYEKIFQPKKKTKERRVRGNQDERSFLEKYKFVILGLLVLLVSFVAYLLCV